MKSNNNMAPAVTPHDFNELVEAVLTAKTSLKGLDWFESRYDSAGQEEYSRREGEVRSACRRLATAAVEASWGQNGVVFITARSKGFGSPGERIRRLYINNCLRAVVDEKSGWVLEVLSAQEGREKREELRAERRSFNSAYMAERKALLKAISLAWQYRLASFGEWRYEGGQLGGTFSRQQPAGRKRIFVAALPAMEKVWGCDWCPSWNPPVHVEEVQDIEEPYQGYEEDWDRELFGARF